MIGTPVNEGIAIAKPFIFRKEAISITEEKSSSYEQEQEKLYDAIDKAREQITSLKELAAEKMGKENIFDAHLSILEDPMLIDMLDKALKDGLPAAAAVDRAKKELTAIFEKIPDPYIKARIADIDDITERLIRIILGKPKEDLALIDQPVVLIARDLTPSETIGLNENVKGIITETGSATSHAAILAKALGLPAVVGEEGIIDKAKDADLVILDTIDDNIIFNPTQQELEIYTVKQAKYEDERKRLMLYAGREAITKDGKKIKVYANIGSLEEWQVAQKYGAEGIGLFRTEFLYMQNDHFPTEDEQFEVYKEITQQGGEEIILRILDIGGDKNLPYYDFPKEMNPFLGNRAVRFLLKNPDVFKAQLKAALRAAVYGNLKIMYPMISSIEELHEANKILQQCKDELKQNGIAYKESMEVGIMVEIPSAAIMADVLARYVDFFSIGTNDLCQYTLAVDRTNALVKELYKPHEPAILRLIRHVTKAGADFEVPVGVCGEMAGEPIYTKWLIGAGVTELSMSAASIPRIKEIIINTTYDECKELVAKTNSLFNANDIENELKESAIC
ncbi:phosphoenolpyruvate--protein phosphotransferase [Mahella sp.]|uniref:phosphoenolpyruvate--protein phosphotransferase n=1 Tax=Mahella sp. TaxID=2798721 RepID=UPI0025BCFFDB|nr:phosphoenolpyruvate--protein phosphotransferase [Mahella sp.]MBZ4665452.1 phosphoenolpyruvate-protein phosphotransferase [Mahella sp.]